MFLEINKFLGQEDIPWDEIFSFFHLSDSVPIKFSEHKKSRNLVHSALLLSSTIKGKLIKNLSPLPSKR